MKSKKNDNFLQELYSVIEKRAKGTDKKSYTRSLIKGGLIGLGHIMKGTSGMGDPIYEYEYIDQYLKRSSISLLWLDLTIILRGIKVMVQGKGLWLNVILWYIDLI